MSENELLTMEKLIDQCYKINKQKTIKLLKFGCGHNNDKMCKQIFFNGLEKLYMSNEDIKPNIIQPSLFKDVKKLLKSQK